MTVFNVRILRSGEALRELESPGFVAEWRALLAECPDASAYQGPDFVLTWYRCYESRWSPVVAVARDADGALVGLWTLAHNEARKMLVHAGAHQAEYQAWLSRSAIEIGFLNESWDQLRKLIVFRGLAFKYLPRAGMAEAILAVPGMAACAETRLHARPLLRLNETDIEASFAKKSNKSRFNRLRKHGELSFERMDVPGRLDLMMDRFIEYYDFRQGAVNNAMPFREDPLKREFHRRLFLHASDLIVAATLVGDELVAAFWGLSSKHTVHLDMMAHSPFLAANSPGKIHLMQLSRHLCSEGVGTLDLTPGGDPWKERFASDHDQVAEVYVHRNPSGRHWAAASTAASAAAKRVLARAGISPDDVRSVLAKIRRQRPSTVMTRLRRLGDMQREFRVYRCERTLADRLGSDPRVSRNSLGDLMAFEPGESWQTRNAFLAASLARLERGETAFTVRIDGRLAHCGWLARHPEESRMTEVDQTMQFPEGSAALYDFYTHPDFRGQRLYQATLAHMVRDVFSDPSIRYAYISVLEDNQPSRHVIEKTGFVYQRSFHLQRRFGRSRTWASPETQA